MTKGWNLHFWGGSVLGVTCDGWWSGSSPSDRGERLEADADVRLVLEDFRALPLFLPNTRARAHRHTKVYLCRRAAVTSLRDA